MLHAIIDYYEKNDNVLLKTGKVSLYSHVAQELSKYSTRPNPWSWRYIDGMVTGRVKVSKYVHQAIEKLTIEIEGLPALVAVPACSVPGCTDLHQHKHGETIKPLAKSSKPDARIRLHPTVDQSLYDAVKGQAAFEGVTMSALIKRGLSQVLYDYEAISRRDTP